MYNNKQIIKLSYHWILLKFLFSIEFFYIHVRTCLHVIQFIMLVENLFGRTSDAILYNASFNVLVCV